MDSFKLIVGLGNPDKQYEGTYHNVGFLAVDYLIEEILEEKNPKWKKGLFKNFLYYKTKKYIFVKPLTFMNLSGQAVKTASKYFKISAEDILIIHDDSDIELGQYKLTVGRGSAGHKGAESIITSLGTKDFYRLRIGIRKNRGKAGSFVLRKICKESKESLYQVLEEVVDIIGLQKI